MSFYKKVKYSLLILACTSVFGIKAGNEDIFIKNATAVPIYVAIYYSDSKESSRISRITTIESRKLGRLMLPPKKGYLNYRKVFISEEKDLLADKIAERDRLLDFLEKTYEVGTGGEEKFIYDGDGIYRFY